MLCLLWNTNQDIVKKNFFFIPYSESQLGPKQHWTPMIFIVRTKTFFKNCLGYVQTASKNPDLDGFLKVWTAKKTPKKHENNFGCGLRCNSNVILTDFH